MTAASDAVALLRWLAGRLEQGGSVEIAGTCRHHADALEAEEGVRASFRELGMCPKCGRPLPARTGKRGRPAVYCDDHNRAHKTRTNH